MKNSKVSRASHPTALNARGDVLTSVVLEAALFELAEVGYERLSIPRIAEIAGVNKTSIYRRWLTKEALVGEALHVAVNHADAPPDTGTLRGDLLALAQRARDLMQSAVGTALIRIMLADGGNETLRELATKSYGAAQTHGPWVVIKNATQRGDFAADADPERMLFTIAGAIMHCIFVERRDVTEADLEQIVDLVLRGAAAPTKR
jgi:AcrR family transcriptional regulator